MVKGILSLLLLSVALHAGSLFKEIENTIGKNSYIANKKIITVLFKDTARFYNHGQVDYPKVLRVLKENHLLNVKFSRSSAITLSFATRQKYPVAFIELVRSTLTDLGYSRIDVQKVIHDKSGFMYKISVYSDSAPDPIMIAEHFAKKRARIVRIKRFSLSNWRYFVDISHLDLVPEKLPYKKKIHLSKPLEPYWINVENVKVVLLESAKANRWHPRIVFYDRFLNILDNVSKDRKSYNLRLEVPRDAMYMKVSDLYTLDNLRRGLTIYLANRR
jgi:hypothetical protein